MKLRTFPSTSEPELFLIGGCGEDEQVVGPESEGEPGSGLLSPAYACDFEPVEFIQEFEGENEIITVTFEMNNSGWACIIDMPAQGIMFGDTTGYPYGPPQGAGEFWASFLERDLVPPPPPGDAWHVENIPSGVRWGSPRLWTYQGYIHFDPPVSKVDLFVDSQFSTRFTAYSQGWFVLDQEVRPPTHVDFPHGVWDSVSVSATSDQIAHLFIDYPDSPTGYFLIDDLKITRAAPPGIECTPDPVTRGDPVTCTIVRTVDSVTGWQFEGITPQEGNITITSSSTAESWGGGEGVLSGQVSAFVTIGGSPATLSGSLNVADRDSTDWQWDNNDWHFTPGGGAMSGTGVCSWGQVTFPLDPSVNRGLNTRFNSCTGGVVDPNPLPNPTTGYDSTTVSGGPNNGLWYVTAAYYEMNRGSSINPYFTDSLPKYALTGNDKKNCGDAVSFNEYNACKGHSLQPMFTGLWNHEEYGTNPAPPEPNGHQSRYELAAGQADDDPYKTVEELVATDTTQLQFSVRDAIIAIDNRIFPFADDHDHVRDNFVNGNKCGKVWLYNTNTNKFVFKELKGENNSCI